MTRPGTQACASIASLQQVSGEWDAVFRRVQTDLSKLVG